MQSCRWIYACLLFFNIFHQHILWHTVFYNARCTGRNDIDGHWNAGGLHSIDWIILGVGNEPDVRGETTISEMVL